MLLEGHFTNINGKDVSVKIITDGSTSDKLHIAANEKEASSPDTMVWFSANDPVQVETECDNILTHLVGGRATITLLTRDPLLSLFTSDVHSVTVTIHTGGYCIFAGYLEPRVYTQEFSDEINQLQLNCVACISSLSYTYFRNIQTTADYELQRREADTSTLMSLMSECLDAATSGHPGYAVFYDGSILATQGGLIGSVFGAKVADILWLGESEDDVRTHEDIMIDILSYLNLHMVQIGRTFFIFSAASLKTGPKWSLLSLNSSEKDIAWSLEDEGMAIGESAYTPTVTAIDVNKAYGSNPSIDIDEVFNQIILNVSPTKLSNALVSPLDNTSMSPASSRFYYVTEYAADGEGERAGRAFWNLVNTGADNGYNGGMTYMDYAVRIMKSKQWAIGYGIGPGSSPWNISEAFDEDETKVTALASMVAASLMQVGARDYKPGKGDTNKSGQISMSDYLVVGVNGNGKDEDDLRYPTEDVIKRSIPVAEYIGGGGNAMYSPADPSMMNYLVISGSIILNPRYRAGYNAETVRSLTQGAFVDSYKAKHMAPSRYNKDGRYLCFEWWRNGAKDQKLTDGWIPYTGDGPQEYEYRRPGGIDKVDKVDVLWCMLRIGEKVLVERKVDEQGNDLTGAIEDFTWKEYKTMSQCKAAHPGDESAAVDEYLEQTFTIGIDPVVGDKIVGDEFAIQTNFGPDTNINASDGMAIPLPYGEKLSGKIVFQILGPDDGYWNDYHKKRHATMFRHSKWGNDNIPLLSHVSSIIIKDFQAKMYSDAQNSGEGNDLAYMSAVTHDFYNRKEISGPSIHSGFTSEEVSAFNLSGDLMVSTVRGADGSALLTVYNASAGEEGKPEQFYVNDVYDWLSDPRVKLTIEIREQYFNPFGKYIVDSAGKERKFAVLNFKRSLFDGYVRTVLIEVAG